MAKNKVKGLGKLLVILVAFAIMMALIVVGSMLISGVGLTAFFIGLFPLWVHQIAGWILIGLGIVSFINSWFI